MIVETLAIIPVMIIAQFFHEAGHFIVHYRNGYNPVFSYSSVKTFANNFDSFKLDSATFAGIVAGLVPLVIYFSLVKLSMPPIIFIPLFIIIMAWYFYGCRSDLKSFFKKEIVEGT